MKTYSIVLQKNEMVDFREKGEIYIGTHPYWKKAREKLLKQVDPVRKTIEAVDWKHGSVIKVGVKK